MIFVTVLLLVLTVGLVHQARRHGRHLHRIPLRIHVNGSRGKSSVTRLIAAGLRAGGIRTIAKTTGTKPRFIYHDGTEVPVVRAGSANIIEQVRIVRRAAQLGAEALVVECMAIKPELQSLLEDRMIRSTHAVLTNVRADHLDEMGPKLTDVARSLGRTIPHRGRFFTAERDHLDMLCAIASERGADVNVALPGSVDEEMLARFAYFEHAENVAVALSVCIALGVEPRPALEGMVSSMPDPGAMRIYRLDTESGEIIFVNGFAANDPDSYVLSWERLARGMPRNRKLLGLVVCRADRIERSRQLGTLLATRLPVDVCVVAGPETATFMRAYRTGNRPREAAITMEGAAPGAIFAEMERHAGPAPLVVFGIGNIVGLGEEIVEQFSSRARKPSGANRVSTGSAASAVPSEAGYV